MVKKEVNLESTISLMQSADYKDRFMAEYLQLKIRLLKLQSMLDRWERGELDFVPTCSKFLLTKQRDEMTALLSTLEERANIEGILINLS